jgi:hypothetical protein
MKKNKFKICLILFLIIIFASIEVIASERTNEFPINLLFNRSDVPKIRENTKLPIFKEFWQSLLETDASKDKNFMRQAFVYVVTGDRKRGEQAKNVMLKSLEMERWDMYMNHKEQTMGFLWAGRMTAWMSLSYDWLYDLLTPKEREAVLQQIAEKGCAPIYRSLYGMRYPETVKKWQFTPEYQKKYDVPDMSRWPIILGHNNFRMVNSGGFSLGIFTLMGKDKRADKWLEMLLDSFNRITDLYETDGSYDEGVSYCNYATEYLLYLMDVINRKLNIELFDAINFVGMMEYDLAMYMPHFQEPRGSVNFGDAGNSLKSDIGFWVARKSRDGLSQYIALNYPGKQDIFSLLYYDPTVKPIPPGKIGYFKKADFDWITTRTGYEIDDLVVAMRSGPPTNHEHADRNSILLKAYGEILLADHKHPTYNYRNPEWLLRTSLAHNTVMIDGQGHQYHNGEEGTNASKAEAKIVRSGQRESYDFWASDATQAYALINPDVKSVTRTTLVFHKIPCLMVLDKLIKKNEPSIFSARWHIENSDSSGRGEVDGKSFIIKRPNAQFYGVCAGSSEISNEYLLLPLPESKVKFPFVEVKTTQKSKEQFLIHVGTPLRTDELKPDIKIDKTENHWLINVCMGGSTLKVRVFDRDELPEFEIVEQVLY